MRKQKIKKGRSKKNRKEWFDNILRRRQRS